MKFETVVWKGNSKGVGFTPIPKNIKNKFDINTASKIKIGGITSFYAQPKLYKKYLGFYIPKSICLGNKLVGKTVKLFTKRIVGTYVTFGTDGRLYIPKIFHSRIKEGDLILMSVKIGNRNISKICRIRKRSNRKEYFCFLGPEYSKKTGIINIESILENSAPKSLREVIKGWNIGHFDGNLIISDGKKIPIKINPSINIKHFAYYLGMFFADGTKKGNSWGISASTFEQAKYFMEMHNKLVFKSNLGVCISISRYKDDLPKNLAKLWAKSINLDSDKIEIRKYKSKVKAAPNRNEYGTLVLKEYRKLTQEYYNRLLDYIQKEAIKKNDIKLAFEFICGILEGDGCVGSKRGHISITTNKNEFKKIKRLFGVVGLNHNGYKESENRYIIRIGALEILNNLLFN